VTVAGAHCTALTVVTGITVTDAVREFPLRVAVIVAVWLAPTVPAVAVKVAVVAPLATVSEAGTDRAALLSESVTAAPPDAAACDKVTVQVEVPPDVTVAGAHWTPLTFVTAPITLIVPPVPAIFALLPSGRAPTILLIAIPSAVAVLVEESVAETTAITPLGIVVVLGPIARQVSEPVPDTQLSALPAAPLSAAPGVALRDTTSVGE
jgi:hypothetical protein